MDNIIDEEKNELVSQLAFYLGAAVILTSLASLAITLIAVIARVFG